MSKFALLFFLLTVVSFLNSFAQNIPKTATKDF
jgi:hypothetical protein